MRELNVEAILKRQDEIARMRPVCPKCKEKEQLQVMNTNPPAQWRCRMCNTRFEWEKTR
jgi:ribosomal protein L37AE/L43A